MVGEKSQLLTVNDMKSSQSETETVSTIVCGNYELPTIVTDTIKSYFRKHYHVIGMI